MMKLQAVGVESGVVKNPKEMYEDPPRGEWPLTKTGLRYLGALLGVLILEMASVALLFLAFVRR
jgi:hypothetical protein